MFTTEPTTWTAAQVAAELHCSVDLVYKLAKRGKLQALQIAGGQRPTLRFQASDVARYLDELNGIRRGDARPPDRLERR